MDVILGIDMGGSSTKVVGLRTDGSVISIMRVRAEDPVTSLYGALGNYLSSNHLALKEVRRIVLTGVGASYVEGDIYGLPTCHVDEFSATGTGALALSGQKSAVVVSMGTGTAFLWASPDGIRHLCGSGIGGGTLGGLCHKLVGMDMTASNFGKLAEDATPADLAAGVMNLVLQAIGTMTVLACQCCSTQTVVLTGSMTSLPQTAVNFQQFEKLYGIHYITPENAAFATAIGAGLCSLAKKPEL